MNKKETVIDIIVSYKGYYFCIDYATLGQTIRIISKKTI